MNDRWLLAHDMWMRISGAFLGMACLALLKQQWWGALCLFALSTGISCAVHFFLDVPEARRADRRAALARVVKESEESGLYDYD